MEVGDGCQVRPEEAEPTNHTCVSGGAVREPRVCACATVTSVTVYTRWNVLG